MKKGTLRKSSQKKSEIATKRERQGGKFLCKDPEKAEQKRKEKEELELLQEAVEASETITDEDRAYIGTDSAKFFEMAMQRSRTYYEGSKYAKELKPIQHPALQSIQSKQEVEVTTRVLRWSWEDDPTVIEAEVIEKLVDDRTNSDSTLQTEQSADVTAQEPEKV